MQYYEQQQVEHLQVNPVKLFNSTSQSKQTFESSILNICRSEHKQFLNVMITDLKFLDLIGQAISFCKVGITNLSNDEKNLIAMYYSNKVILVNENIYNKYIDILITDNLILLKKISSNNYIKYVYSVQADSILETYKKYRTTIQGCYFYLNKSSEKSFIPHTQNSLIDLTLIQKENTIIEVNEKQKNIGEKLVGNNSINQDKNIVDNIKSNTSNYQCIENTLSIIISMVDNEPITLKCLKSLNRYIIDKYKTQIILIYDGTKNLNIDKIKHELKFMKNIHVTELFHSQRIGYIKSTNQGIKYALNKKSQYIILLHNDAQFSENWKLLIENLKSFDVTYPITGSYVYNRPQSIKHIRLSNIFKDFPQSFQKCKTATINDMLKVYSNKILSQTQINCIPSLFCMAFKASIFNDIGLLNQKYGEGFGQDVELYYRLLSNNYKIGFVPAAYIPHVGRQTLKDIYDLKQSEKLFNAKYYISSINNSLNYQKKKKSVIYTCITNRYDFNIRQTTYNTEQFDYVCFTQHKDMIKQPWIFVDLNKIKSAVGVSDPIKLARFFKTHPHLFFKNYQTSIWCDGNVDIIQDPSYLRELLYEDQNILIPKHPQRTSVYEEAQACKSMKKDTEENIDRLLKYLKQQKFQDSTGLVQSSIILRRHNEKDIIILMENWWNLIKNYSCRDQLSFNFCVQKLNTKISTLNWDYFQNKYIQWSGKHGYKNK